MSLWLPPSCVLPSLSLVLSLPSRHHTGAVIVSETLTGVRSVEVEFHDTQQHRAVRFADDFRFSLAALCTTSLPPAFSATSHAPSPPILTPSTAEQGVVLASKIHLEEDADPDIGESAVPAQVSYRPFASWAGQRSRWSYRLDGSEDVELVATGKDWVAAATTRQVSHVASCQPAATVTQATHSR